MYPTDKICRDTGQKLVFTDKLRKNRQEKQFFSAAVVWRSLI